MNALVNGINSSDGGLNLTVNSSDVARKGSISLVLTVNNSKVNVVNGSELKLTGSLINDIVFKGEGTVKIDENLKK